MTNLLAWTIAGILMLVTVLMHYETMLLVSDRLLPWARRRFRGRRVMMASTGALMIGHIVEIWLFAIVIMTLLQWPAFGHLSGDFDGGFNGYLYFSAVSYTSLGDNNIRPEGAIRALAATETLTGLMMIAWSASFTYLKMEEIWNARGRKET